MHDLRRFAVGEALKIAQPQHLTVVRPDAVQRPVNRFALLGAQVGMFHIDLVREKFLRLQRNSRQLRAFADVIGGEMPGDGVEPCLK